MTARFPILSLHPRAFRRIAKYLTFCELFWISTSSTKGFNLVKNAMMLVSQDQKLKMNVKLASSCQVKFFRTCISFGVEAEWNFYGRLNSKRFGIEDNPLNSVKIHTDFTDHSMDFWEESENCYGCASGSIEEVLDFVRHVANLFDGTIIDLSIAPERSSCLESIQSIELFRKSSYVTVKKGTLNHDSMRRFLEGFEAETLNFKCSIDANFNFQEIQIPDNVTVRFRALFDNPMRLAYQCKTLSLECCEISQGDIHQFFCHWKESYNRVTQQLTLTRVAENKELSGIYDNRWSWNQQQEKWFLKNITHGLHDILQSTSLVSGPFETLVFKRKTDGMLLQVRRGSWRSLSELFISTTFYPENPNFLFNRF